VVAVQHGAVSPVPMLDFVYSRVKKPVRLALIPKIRFRRLAVALPAVGDRNGIQVDDVVLVVGGQDDVTKAGWPVMYPYIGLPVFPSK
jgi:hypothetical protein